MAEGNKFHEGIDQALHYGDVTGQQPVLALISAYYNIFGAEQQKLEYVSGLCAAHGVEVWALTTRRGNAVAQYNLGVMYAKGEGVRRDDTILRL